MGIFSDVKDKVTQYIDVYVKLFKLNFIMRTSNVLSYFMFAMIGMLIVLCVALFTGLGLVEVFISLEMSKMAAFFIVIGIYLLLLLILILCRRPVTRFFASGIIRALTEGDQEEKEEKE